MEATVWWIHVNSHQPGQERTKPTEATCTMEQGAAECYLQPSNLCLPTGRVPPHHHSPTHLNPSAMPTSPVDLIASWARSANCSYVLLAKKAFKIISFST
jgi:hypothetical protein